MGLFCQSIKLIKLSIFSIENEFSLEREGKNLAKYAYLPGRKNIVKIAPQEQYKRAECREWQRQRRRN
jgi:hypothetical protein